VRLSDGTSLTFQEASLAALVRAYVAVKTTRCAAGCSSRGGRYGRKAGYAEWQLLEEPEEEGLDSGAVSGLIASHPPR
jgi:hypothetical protein